MPPLEEQAPTDDSFSAAFAELTTPEKKEDKPVAAEDPPVETPPVETPPVEEPPVETPPVETPPVETPPVETPPVEEPPAVAKETDDEILAKLASLVNKAPAPKEEVIPAAVTPTEEVPAVYTEDEQAFLTTYEKDWGDVSKGESLKRRAEYRELVGFVYNAIMQQVAPMKDTVEAIAGRTALTDLRSKVSDYDDVREKVVDWVGNQPDYLQTAYNKVIQEGTVDEVADLIDRYRKDTGVPAVVNLAPTEKKGSELSTAAKQAAAALAPVGSKRSIIPQDEDMSNFDAAFDKFGKLDRL